MSFCQAVIQFNRLYCRRFCFWISLLWPQHAPVASHQGVSIRKPGPRQRIGGVFLGGGGKELNCLFEIVTRALVPVVSPFEVKIVCLAARRCPLVQSLALLACEPLSQFVGNIPRNLLLDGRHVR